MDQKVIRERVLRALEVASEPLSAHQLARETGVEFVELTGVKEMGDRTLLEDLEDDGLIEIVETGSVFRYRVPEREG